MPPPLDVRIEEVRRQPGRTWGVPDALLGLVTVPAALGLLAALVLSRPGLSPVVATSLANAVLAALAVLAGRRPARQSGGWTSALGLVLPDWPDVRRILGWTVALVVAQGVLVAVLRSAVPPLRGAVADNASFLAREPLFTLVAYAVAAVTVAPVVEELLFRGLVLRGLMLRLGFWPAAVVSSVCFGAFHAQSADAGAVLLTSANGLFGLGLCLLARSSGRLGPGIGVHALRNALAFVLVVGGAR
jgi:membrane protease YdiL (CAAX protease family)